MKFNRTSKHLTTLTLLMAVSACSSNSTSISDNLPTITTAETGQRGNSKHDDPTVGAEKRTACEALKQGPIHSTEHGPLDNADLNRDGTVVRAELETFMDQGKYRRITILTFFDLFDTDKDEKLSKEEMAKVDPPYGFDGTDSNGDCVVTRNEVIAYASQTGRSYRKIGLGKFFDLVDTNGDSKVTPTEIEAAHISGLLERF